jgi:hypothetical protein
MIRNMITDMRSEVQLRWGMVLTAALMAGLLLPVSEAGAVSARVKFACANDYFAHCSQFKPDTPGVRNCMRQVGDNLSKRCIAALDAEGEVTDADKAQHVASQHDDE